MANAKEELLRLVEPENIKCAFIFLGDNWEYDENNNFVQIVEKSYILRINHLMNELRDFIESLDFKYDSGYGGQELYGNVWLKDGTWLERGEYDGSEWWEHKVLPKIPEQCLEH